MKQLFAFLFLIACLLGLPRQARSETIFALTNSNQLLSFDSATPGTTSALVPVTGLLPGEALVGIDFRPAVSGQLVGVGQVGTTGTVYTINSVTGAATSINTIPTLIGGPFGIDFNPVPDALRIVSSTGQNLRITAGGTGVVNTDVSLNPGTPGVSGAAYSNNVPGGVGGVTTLYVIDFLTDTLATQGSPSGAPVSPNTGTLFMVGPLGVNTGALVGFDISGFSGTAFASLTPPVGSGLGSNLYTINLSTGAATLVGAIGSGSVSVQSLSVLPAPAAVPEPGSLSLLSAALLGLVGYRFRRK